MNLKKKIIIGTWPLSGDFGTIDTDEARKTLEYCSLNGLNSFDTAPNYGRGTAEKYLGDVFEGSKEIIINTKCGSTIDNKKKFEFSDLEISLVGSLERLKRDTVNVLYLHNPRNEAANLKDPIFFLKKQKNNGIISNTGLSMAKDFNYNINQINSFDCVQNDVNLLYLKPILSHDYSQKKFHARSPLATGLLSGNKNSKSSFNKNDYRSSWLKGKRLKSIMLRIKELEKLHNLPIKFLAMKFVLENSLIDKVIFGIKSREHVNDLLYVLSLETLPKALFKTIENLYLNDFYLSEEHKSLGY